MAAPHVFTPFYFDTIIFIFEKKSFFHLQTTQLQGDPNQNPLFQMAVPLKLYISEFWHYIGKAIMRLRGGSFFF